MYELVKFTFVVFLTFNLALFPPDEKAERGQPARVRLAIDGA